MAEIRLDLVHIILNLWFINHSLMVSWAIVDRSWKQPLNAFVMRTKIELILAYVLAVRGEGVVAWSKCKLEMTRREIKARSVKMKWVGSRRKDRRTVIWKRGREDFTTETNEGELFFAGHKFLMRNFPRVCFHFTLWKEEELQTYDAIG